MKGSDLPPILHRSEIKFVDMTPDRDLPIRILRAYREDCNSRWAVSGVSEHSEALWDFMNQCQEKRAAILDQAIALLVGFTPADPGEEGK